MSRSTRPVLLALSACLGLGACSSIVTGTGQQIAVSTPGASDATCQLAGGDGVNATINTPASVHVPKSKKNIEVTCTAPNRAAVTQTRQIHLLGLVDRRIPAGLPDRRGYRGDVGLPDRGYHPIQRPGFRGREGRGKSVKHSFAWPLSGRGLMRHSRQLASAIGLLAGFTGPVTAAPTRLSDRRHGLAIPRKPTTASSCSMAQTTRPT